MSTQKPYIHAGEIHNDTAILDVPTTSDVLVGRDTTDTLTNKTISATNNTISGLNTDNVAEASNLYYTDARVDARITAQKGVNNGLATLDAGGKVPSSQMNLDGSVVYQGNWNASTNTPTLSNGVGTKGHYYKVSVDGSTNIDGETDWKVGDWIIFNGTLWEKNDNTDKVLSVAGKTGIVVLDTDNVAEGSNLYYTDARFDTRLATKDTSDIAEGSNFYFTNARADARITAQKGVASGLATLDGSGKVPTSQISLDTDNVAEGSNLYYTNSRFDTRLASKSTTNLSEGTNLYYTDARADARITAQKGANNGLATLNSSGKVPSSQLDISGGGGSISYVNIIETSTTSTTSGSYTPINGMTTTPSSGTYLVSFSSSMEHSNGSSNAQYAIFVGGTKVNDSERNFGWDGGSHTNGYIAGVNTQCVCTVNGSQDIDVRWLDGGNGTFTCYERSLILIKIA